MNHAYFIYKLLLNLDNITEDELTNRHSVLYYNRTRLFRLDKQYNKLYLIMKNDYYVNLRIYKNSCEFEDYSNSIYMREKLEDIIKIVKQILNLADIPEHILVKTEIDCI